MERVLQQIPIGKENAISMTELADRLNVSTSTVKHLVRDARQQGYEIISGLDGYWFTEDVRDKKAFVTEMQKQAYSRLKSAKHIRNTLGEFEGQESLFGAADHERKES